MLLLQCDNHTTCVDIIAMVSDGIDDNNINPDNKNLYRYNQLIIYLFTINTNANTVEYAACRYLRILINSYHY